MILADFYKDPLFSIIVIILIIVVAVIIDQIKSAVASKAKINSINALANAFKYHGIDSNISALMDVSKYPSSTLTFIANVYVNNGNFTEAIKIYLTILEKIKNTKEKLDILELLGITYYKAGFMQRSKNIFIEVLKNDPKNIKALSLLMQSYEILGEYKNALEVISCLEELDSNIKNAKAYIQILMLINDSMMGLNEREEKILEINKKNEFTNKIVLNYLKTYNIDAFWDLLIEKQNIREYIDLLWIIENPPLEKIKNNKGICDIYRAKEMINDDIKCDVFELEALRVINKYSNIKANLIFKYRCSSCYGIYPFESSRCPSCNELVNMNLVMEIIKDDNEKNYSLL